MLGRHPLSQLLSRDPASDRGFMPYRMGASLWGSKWLPVHRSVRGYLMMRVPSSNSSSRAWGLT